MHCAAALYLDVARQFPKRLAVRNPLDLMFRNASLVHDFIERFAKYDVVALVVVIVRVDAVQSTEEKICPPHAFRLLTHGQPPWDQELSERAFSKASISLGRSRVT